MTTGAVDCEFDIVNDGEIMDLTDEAHSIYNQIIRGDIEGVKIGDGTHKRLTNFPLGSQARRLVRAISLLRTQTVNSPLLLTGYLINRIPTPERPVRTVSGSVLPHQTTAKVHCFTILTQSKNYAAIPTKE